MPILEVFIENNMKSQVKMRERYEKTVSAVNLTLSEFSCDFFQEYPAHFR